MMTTQFNLYRKMPQMAEFRKIRVLGMGTYGVVYLAALVSPQEANRKIIAVKSSKPQLAYSLKKEAIILESLIGCEEIIQYIGRNITTENNGEQIIYNLLMEFAPYGSLGNLIKKRPLLEDEARTYTRMILNGLSSIHRNGIVHCDLKPDNILLFHNPFVQFRARFRLKIADFGLSRIRGVDEESNDDDCCKMGFRGTPLYMSPESVMGEIDAPLDIWSLGCIVIEMMTGLTAWCSISDTAETLMFKLGCLKQAPNIPDGLSQNCKDFLSKCFVKDPRERWTATMLLNHPFLYHTFELFPSSQGFFTPYFS